MRLTVGPLPPAVYWRRRAIVLGGVLLVLFLVAQACMSASASSEKSATPEPTVSGAPTAPATTLPATPTSTPTGSPPATPSGTPTGTASATPPVPNACTDDELAVTAEADRTEFPQGTSVQFTIRIQNAADRACNRDIGGDLRELFLRTSEGGKVWSSRDCNPPAGSQVTELEPDFDSSYWTVWSGRASDECDGPEPGGELVPPGEYELVARLGTAYSEPLPITIE
ncbi:MAG TPA: hypothetical protein VIL37_18505 [Natronosporangium sp.]